MPIHWTISHEEKLVTARTEGAVGLQDVEAYLDDLVVQDAMSYAKLFDASDLSPIASDNDLMMLAARMRAYASTMPSGPLALVATARAAREIVDRYVNLASGQRPVRVFAAVSDAQDWLKAQR